ncbi:MAG: rhomboid family intramembrane serine protease [Deltaproteobacteria bacterium]|nr:MAG: rhomboid family intramembrane serine protease [Deltaproteobacteria bacterium]
MSPRGQQAMGFGVPPLTRGVKWLGGATLAISVLAAVLGDTGERLKIIVAFTPARFWHGWVWQPLTYTFLNLDPISLLFALLGLWLLGASLEQMWGTRRFITFYMVTGATGALVTGLIGFLLGPVWLNPYFGNWSSLEGLIAAFAVLMPTARIFLYFIPVQARWMLPISAGITLLFMLMGQNLLLRTKVWWIDRKLRRSKLRVVRGKDDEGGPFTGTGSGSDKYLH